MAALVNVESKTDARKGTGISLNASHSPRLAGLEIQSFVSLVEYNWRNGHTIFILLQTLFDKFD